jgi:hypothetical protein
MPIYPFLAGQALEPEVLEVDVGGIRGCLQKARTR